MLCRNVDIFRDLTAEDVLDVYLSGLPILHDPSAPAPVPPGCVPMSTFTYSDDIGSVNFAHQSDSYITYSISGQEASLVNQYVHVLVQISFLFQNSAVR